MRYYYRCMKCRSRNVFAMPVEMYIRPRKCKSCGHARFYADKERTNRQDYCRCDGWHHTHRRGSTYCLYHPQRQLLDRLRAGESRADIALDLAFDSPVTPAPTEVPF
jgi:predicted nucleic-acid-binding Zn-ribbon protein